MAIFGRQIARMVICAVDTYPGFAGVKCRTFATVDHLEWNFDLKNAKAEISSLIDQQVIIKYRNGLESIKVDGVLVESRIQDQNHIELQFRAGQSRIIEIFMR